MMPTLVGIGVAILLVVLGWLRGVHQTATTWTVAGTPNEWLQRCNDALEAMPHVSEVQVDEDRCTVTAKHHRPGGWARLSLSMRAVDQESTRVTMNISVVPTPLTGVRRPEPRIVDRFSTQVGIDEHAVQRMPATG
jgi:hypothetical protein